MNFAHRAPVILVMTVAFFSASARAEDSNRNEVRANLEKDGWRVVWGKNFTEADWARGTKAIVESVASENPGPFLAWFEATLQENLDKIQSNLKGVTRADLDRWIVQSLKSKRPIAYKGLVIEAGFATYDRWQRVVYDEPRTRMEMRREPITGIKTKVPVAYTERVEKRANLPNWHQFYVRYKLVPVGGAGPKPAGGGGGGGGSEPRVVKVDYKIKNESGRAVRFEMQPSGRGYTLDAGKTFTGTSSEVNGKAPSIKLLDSGRTFKLTAGTHKFWWMTNEKRIGFDRSTD